MDLSSLKLSIGWYVLLGIALFPLVLWRLSPTQVPIVSMVGIGKAFGLLGTAFFSLSFILSTRLHILEKVFEGFNKIYSAHSKIGQLGLIFLLFHPLFLIQNNSDSLDQAIFFLLPSSNWAINWGIFGLALLLILIVVTLYLRPKYNIWKTTHKYLGLAFFLGILHVYLIPSDTAAFMPLRIYMLVLVFLGLVAFIYKTLLGTYLIKQFEYVVASVQVVNDHMTEIILQPKYDALSFIPGQFVFLRFFGTSLGTESHPFSIASSPDQKELRIIAKNLGDYTARLPEIGVGTKALVEGPYGSFNYQAAAVKRQIWIAGGVGITPFLSMAASLPSDGDYTVDLYYCVKNDADACKTEELQALQNESLRIMVYSTQKYGHLSAALIEKNTPDLLQAAVFICAPPAMIRTLRQEFVAARVPVAHIYSEEFEF